MTDDPFVRIADGSEQATFGLGEPEQSLADLFGPPGGETPDTLVAAARLVLGARARKVAAEDGLKAANAAVQHAEGELLRKMEEAGVKSVKLDSDGKTVQLAASVSVYYALPAGALDESDVHVWLLRMGGHDLVRRTIHHASFSSFCRELVEAGKPVHPDVRVTEKKTVSVRGN